jgi:rhodanese-related sulfurtransferase
MLSIKTIIVALSLIIFQTAVAQSIQNKSFENKLHSLLFHDVVEIDVVSAKQEREALFLDAREWNEFEVSHIKNAIWCGYSDFDLNRVSAIDKDKRIIVYCSIGYRSEKISEKLIKAGYSNVSNLYGGIFEWKNTGNDVFNQRDSLTQNVHAFNVEWGIWLDKGKKIYQ